ncbi:MAG: hypothetical protein ABI944_00705 [Chthoniobacterales bacterium]
MELLLDFLPPDIRRTVFLLVGFLVPDFRPAALVLAPREAALLDLPRDFPCGALLPLLFAEDFFLGDFPRLPAVDFFAAEPFERDPDLPDFLRDDAFEATADTLFAVAATLRTAFFA